MAWIGLRRLEIMDIPDLAGEVICLSYVAPSSSAGPSGSRIIPNGTAFFSRGIWATAGSPTASHSFYVSATAAIGTTFLLFVIEVGLDNRVEVVEGGRQRLAGLCAGPLAWAQKPIVAELLQ